MKLLCDEQLQLNWYSLDLIFSIERVPPQVEIRGTGIEAKIYKGISSIMQKKKLNINFKQCVPKPKSPNFYSYTHIGKSHMAITLKSQ